MSVDKKIQKKKRQSIAFNKRLEILQRLNDGEIGTKLAEEYGIAISTVSKIKKNKDDIMQKQEQLALGERNPNMKKFRNPKESEVDEEVYKWLCDKRHTGASITGSVLKTLALHVSRNIPGPSTFKASDGWLRRFKNRHSLRWVNINGEKLSSNPEGADKFKNEFRSLIELSGVHNLDHIYNCDETSLYWKLLPNKIFICQEEHKVSGRKQQKCRVTVMVCTNASGNHKIPLYVIGKSKQPRCLKNKKNLPVHYVSQHKAWMDRELFSNWYETCFIPAVKEHHNFGSNKDLKIILLMDNASCHPPAEELHKINTFCTIIYLPPNTKFLIQPCNQGVIEQFKRMYKHILLKNLLIDKSIVGFEKAYQSLQLTDCFNFCSQAWNHLSPENIRNCWKPLLPFKDGELSPTSIIDIPDSHQLQQLLSILINGQAMSLAETNQWLNCDQQQQFCAFSSDVKSENNLTSSDDEDYEEEVDEDVEETSEEPIPLQKVYNSIKTIQKWCGTCNKRSFSNLRTQLDDFSIFISDEFIQEELLK